MEKKIDFTKSGGFPLDQDILNFMQTAYVNAITALASAVGDRVILSGVENDGTAVTDGFVCINGEILPFTGGNAAVAKVRVEESAASLLFGDLSQKPVLITRRAKLDASGTIGFADFVRVPDLRSLASKVSTKQLEIIWANGWKTAADNGGFRITDNTGYMTAVLQSTSSGGEVTVRKTAPGRYSLLDGDSFTMMNAGVPVVYVSVSAEGNPHVIIRGLPTSGDGLHPGEIWRDGNTLKIV
jgi:hypothetical protein